MSQPQPLSDRARVQPAAPTGFTLVEALVCISIIVILLAMLLPAIGRAKESARRSLCASNQRQIVYGFLLYGAEHKRLLPPGECDNPNISYTWRTSTRTKNLMANYTAGGYAVTLKCPDEIDYGVANQDFNVGPPITSLAWKLGFNQMGGHLGTPDDTQSQSVGDEPSSWPRTTSTWASPVDIDGMRFRRRNTTPAKARDPGLIAMVSCRNNSYLVAATGAGASGRHTGRGPTNNTTVSSTLPSSIGAEGSNVTYLDGRSIFRKMSEMTEYSAASYSTASNMTAWW